MLLQLLLSLVELIFSVTGLVCFHLFGRMSLLPQFCVWYLCLWKCRVVVDVVVYMSGIVS